MLISWARIFLMTITRARNGNRLQRTDLHFSMHARTHLFIPNKLIYPASQYISPAGILNPALMLLT